jgi:hypothetical protein
MKDRDVMTLELKSSSDVRSDEPRAADEEDPHIIRIFAKPWRTTPQSHPRSSLGGRRNGSGIP